MEFVSVRDMRLRPGQVWRRLGKGGEIVVTSNGRPVAVMTGVTAAGVEDTLRALRLARFGQAIDKLREEARARGLNKMTMAEINREIQAVRRERRSRTP